jgi:hypothetical protein
VRALLVIAITFAWARLDAEPAHFSSGPARVALIELYTSEGCSSCPPADQWLGDLRKKSGLWKDFVPVEFHVNYWDNLGWKDRLSSPAFTAREYAYASAWNSQNVYTPCFVRDGVEWRPSWGNAGGQGAPVGLLSVDVGPDGTCSVVFSPGPAAASSPDGRYVVHMAYLGGGLSSKVTAGENLGYTLTHEFVVLAYSEELMAQDQGSPTLRASVPFPRPTVQSPTRHALAAWVTPHGVMAPVQAAGSWLP